MERLSTPSRRRGPARRLDQATVVTTALAVLDEGGPPALSVRAVAARLGLQPNALYTYVADRAALERAIAESVLGTADVEVLRDQALPPRARITTYAHRLRAALLAHPGVAPLLLSAPMDGPAALLVGELLLAVLADAGLAPDDAARATYLLIVLVVGAVALEAAETDGRAPLPPEEARIAGRRAAMAAIPPDALPRTAAAADRIAAWIGTDQLDWMLDRTLDGILSGTPGPR